MSRLNLYTWMIGKLMSNKILTLYFICVVTMGSLVSANEKSTLAGAMVGAYSTSGLLEQNRAVLRAADEDVATAASSLAPVISWASTVSHNDRNLTNSFDTSATVSLLADFTVYDGGRRTLGLEAAKYTVFATRASLVSIEQNILFEAVKAYMAIVRETENVSLRKGNLSVISEELRAANDRFEVGEITKTDVALAEARLAASNSTLAFATGTYEQARANYRAAVGEEPKGPLEYPTTMPKVPDSLQ